MQEPIVNYFPQIIDEETYNRVQATFQQWDKNEKHQGGRNGIISNLFRNLAYCSECNFPIQYVNKGYTTKGGQHLICDKELRVVDGGCTKSKIKYSLFEDYLLTFCSGLDVSDIIPNSKKRLSEIADLNNHLKAVKFELSEILIKLPKIAEEIVTTSNETLKNVHRHNSLRLALRKEELEKDQKITENKISELNYSTQNSGQQLKDIQDLISRMKELDGQARIDLRLSLRNQLRHLIKKIVVHLDDQKAVIFFQSGQRRAINFITGRVTDAYPKSAGYIKTDKGFIKKQ